MANSNSSGHRQNSGGKFIKGLMVIAVIILILYSWYNANQKTFMARMADIGFTAGEVR